MKASCSLQQPAMLKSVEVSRHKNCGYIATVCMHLMHLLIISDPDTFLSLVLYSSIHILDFTAQLPGYTSVCGVRGLDRTIYFHLNLKTDSINKKMFSSKADVTLISIYRIKFTTSLCVCVCVFGSQQLSTTSFGLYTLKGKQKKRSEQKISRKTNCQIF